MFISEFEGKCYQICKYIEEVDELVLFFFIEMLV